MGAEKNAFREVMKTAGRPYRIVLAVSFDEEKNRPDIITLGWKMWTSFQPPMVCISVGNTRYSRGLIADGGEFVLAFPGGGIAQEVLFCGTSSGRDTDKFRETGLTPVKGGRVIPPLIKECPVNLECRLDGVLETGDHTVFSGRVLCSHVSGAEKPLLGIGSEKGYDLILEKRGYRFGVVKG